MQSKYLGLRELIFFIDMFPNIFLGLMMNSGNYDERKIDRLEPVPEKSIGVSTCNTYDEGYETALLDANGAHPVERYATKELAIKGHKKWVSKSKKLNGKKIKKIGPSDMPELGEDIILEA